MNITLAQREALGVVKDMIDKSNTSVPEYGTKIMTLIFGILNIDCRVEPVTPSIIADPDSPDNTLPIDYDGLRDGNDRLIVPDWIKTMPTPPFVPGDVTYPNQLPFPPQVWYFVEPMDSAYVPKQKKFVEKSMYGIAEGTIIFNETR